MSNAHEILAKLWPIYYHDIAGSDDPTIASWDCHVYERAQSTLKALFRVAYPMVPADYVYEQCADSGELLSAEVLMANWVTYCNNEI